jgi:hypothetical protein
MQIKTKALVALTNTRNYKGKDGTEKTYRTVTLAVNNNLYQVSVRSEESFKELNQNYGKTIDVTLDLVQYGDTLSLKID